MTAIPTVWRRFYAVNVLGLALTAAMLLWGFHVTTLDLRIESYFYDAAAHQFPARKAWWAAELVHRDLKAVLVLCGIGACLLAMNARFRWREMPVWAQGRERCLATVAATFVITTSIIGLLKRLSPMHCPWDVAGYGGASAYIDVMSATAFGSATGHCFPAAFVGVGAWLMSFSLCFYAQNRLRSALWWWAAIALAFALGWVQMMRGAHFLSHVLWSLWLSWAIALGLHAFVIKAWRDLLASPQGAALAH